MKINGTIEDIVGELSNMPGQVHTLIRSALVAWGAHMERVEKKDQAVIANSVIKATIGLILGIHLGTKDGGMYKEGDVEPIEITAEEMDYLRKVMGPESDQTPTSPTIN